MPIANLKIKRYKINPFTRDKKLFQQVNFEKIMFTFKTIKFYTFEYAPANKTRTWRTQETNSNFRSVLLQQGSNKTLKRNH